MRPMEEPGRRWYRLAIASAFTTMLLAAPGQAAADPGGTVFPGMEIRQGNTVCMVGLVEPRLRVAMTSGQCDGGQSVVTDRDRKPIGSVVLGVAKSTPTQARTPRCCPWNTKSSRSHPM